MSLLLENLDNRTFEQLVEEAKKRIPIYAPQWTDFNLHDPGITLIELFAWLTEMQIYRLNKVTDESYRTFLKLVGILEAEDLEPAVLSARKGMKAVSRAVTSDDYERLALNTKEVKVARAKAVPRYHPNQHQEVPGVVTVIAVPGAEIQDSEFLEAVFNHLDHYRLLTTRLFVTLPFYIAVGVKASVVIKPEYLESTVAVKVKEALDSFLDPLSGGKDGNGWPFGRTVYVSEIYEVIDGVEGVDYVETGSVNLKKEDEQWQDADIPIPRHALVCPGSHVITAREE
ncbi:MAG: hypothetical protein GTO45_00665 [Candidatus Aminicenantes bacterium]|nr:hypothetical protein [Candidatus Aminicenantes bacterium]NIM77274.1 hypothetical protein [Candidatus Aminicenantes bacterium]NIN16575.1 hypothetical protein [Candidatus Aminicenantes bacterium]NIN40433.1 hypothetical protein [Candidatus Aminicenantes bacterium]NIN83253.1 hypothetical protein [Candidatus Aminicenantes bacterium]